MKQQKSKAAKVISKDTSATNNILSGHNDQKRTAQGYAKKKSKPGKGGKRKGAGRKRFNGPFKTVTYEFAVALIKAIEMYVPEGKQDYFVNLIMVDLKKRGLPKKLQDEIEFAYTKQE